MNALYETAFSDFKVESLFTPKSDVLAEQYGLYVKPNFDTACWMYAPPHRIFVGDKVLKRLKAPLTDERKVEYLKKYLWHEYAHACLTERDFERTNKELKRIKAPFGVYNRFEDIRIEHHARQRWDDFKFEWSLYEDLSPVLGSSARDADGILFLLTQLEGDVLAVRKLVKDQTLFDEVLPFYRDACLCRTSLALMPVIERWIRKFPMAVHEQASGGMQDMSVSMQLALVPGALDAFMADVQAEGDDDDQEDAQFSLYDPRTDESREAGTGQVLGKKPHRIHDADVKSVTDLLANLYAPRLVSVSTETPTKRLSARHDIMGRGPYRRKELHSKRRKKIVAVIDCSGSMSGLHIAAARVLVASLSDLAEAGAVEGYVILSMVGEKGPVWERFTLPMSREAIQRIIAPGGAEGLAPTLDANRQLASEADLLLVFTDGNITDKPLDKQWLHTLGVFTIGAYVGSSPEAVASLQRYFDRVLVRTSITDLVRDLIVTL